MGAGFNRITVIEALADSLVQAATKHSDAVAAPCAVLWTDPKSNWRPLLPRLRELVPSIFSFGDYSPDTQQGPAIWIRAALDGTESKLSVPVLYLPGVSINDLRAGKDCSNSLKPLVELQYRGTVWKQKNGKDWTVVAFLVSKDIGLRLNLGRDERTRDALHNAIAELGPRRVEELCGQRLEAAYFHGLLCPDLFKDCILWLNDPVKIKHEFSSNKWLAFRELCRRELAFDPDKDGELSGAEHMGGRRGPWAQVWVRFAEAPHLYPNIDDLLRRARPNGVLPPSPPSWPQTNEEQETNLRTSLSRLPATSAKECRDEIIALERSHSPRRHWVWAKLGQAPLANAVGQLARLAQCTAVKLGGDSIATMARLYEGSAWEADESAISALAAVSSLEDERVVTAVIKLIYAPWLQAAAEHFQQLVENDPLPRDQAQMELQDGEILLFADALRFDIAKLLIRRGETKGWNADLKTRWAGLPTVTATAKCTVSPIAKQIAGGTLSIEFQPNVAETNKPLTTDRFRRLLGQHGVDYIPKKETGNPQGRGWTEYGELDNSGHHSDGIQFASRIQTEITRLIGRIEELFEAGWQIIRVVTDHGWLWLPSGLPKTSLPKYITESQWSRCATIKGYPVLDVPTVPWHWNESEYVAVAPGISCFRAGHQYSHGGVSLQECLIPIITITNKRPSAAASVSIESLYWRGLRCYVELDSAPSGLVVQLRTKVQDVSSAISPAKPVNESGRVSLLVSDDDHEGQSATAVILDMQGRVITRKPTIVGGDE